MQQEARPEAEVVEAGRAGGLIPSPLLVN